MTVSTNLWVDWSQPVLRWLADHEDGEKGIVSLDTIATATGLTARQVEVELERLEIDGLVLAQIHRTMNGGNIGAWFVVDPRLTGEGARRLDMWPPAESLLVVVERMARESTDPVEKSRLERLASAVVHQTGGVCGRTGHRRTRFARRGGRRSST